MNMFRKTMRYGLIAAMLVFLGLGIHAQAAGDTTYTAHNIWFEQPERMYAINYKKGRMIPIGTEVTNVEMGKEGRWKVVTFTIPEWQTDCKVYINRKYQPDVAPETIRDRMFTDQPKKKLLKPFNKSEKKAIEAGVVTKGMSKDAVIVAVGYPPKHRTPSLEMNSWVYWLDRWRSREVRFDSEGRTTDDMPQ